MFLVVPFSAWLGLTPQPSDTPHLPSHRGSDVEVKDLLKGDLVDFAHYEERLTVPGTHWATPPNLDGTDGWDGPDDGMAGDRFARWKTEGPAGIYKRLLVAAER